MRDASLPRYLLLDRDASSGPAFRDRAKEMGINRAAITLAESICRTPHRLDPPRMFGSRHHLQRASLPARPIELFSISSQDQNPPVT
jgi:hypothetical protein